jgi:transketolase N-terminal domain/subunit
MNVRSTEAIVDATLEQAGLLARQLRMDSIRASTAAGSGHPTSSLSAADLMAALMASHRGLTWRPVRWGRESAMPLGSSRRLLDEIGHQNRLCPQAHSS